MYLKLFLLCLYVILLFLLARILDALTWFENGHLPKQLLDPMTLSVLKLKALLEQRGVTFDNVVEKKELRDLVESTGSVSDEDIEITPDEEETSLTNFTGGGHFFEEVEDNKDSVWLVQVVMDHHVSSLLSENGWKALRRKVSRFGVRIGVFDCSMDTRYCYKKGWTSARLILALPQDFQTKANVMIHTYRGASKLNSLYDWIKQKVDSKIEHVRDYKQFQENWLTHRSSWDSEIRVVLLAHLSTIPLFFSALAVKFPGRVRFGYVDTKTKNGRNITKSLKIQKVPSYMIMTPEKSFRYGERKGEKLCFSSMEKFLNSLYPTTNDIFILNLFFANLLVTLTLFLTQGGLIRRLCNFLWTLFKYNILLFIVWIIILGVLQIPLTDTFTFYILKLNRFLMGSSLGCLLRQDFQFFSNNIGYLLMLYTGFCIIVGYIEYKRTGGEIHEDEIDWWNFRNSHTLEYLFYPATALIRPPGYLFNPRSFSSNFPGELEEGFEVFGNTPSLWLQPIVSHDYIKDLPTWNYKPEMDGDGESKEAEYVQHTKCQCLGGQENSEHHFSTSVTADALMDGNYKCECNKETLPSDINDVINLSTDQTSFENAEQKSNVDDGESNAFTQTTDNFQKQQSTMPPGYIESQQCVICLDSYDSNSVLCGLPCGHSFHEECILVWLTRENHLCPVCRWVSYKKKLANMHLHSE